MINEALATLDNITDWAPLNACARLQMLRLYKLHPVVSGNKWYKLKYNAAAAVAAGKDTLLTFGGGYSNHLVATAFVAKEAGLKSIGLVRGHYTGNNFTDTLRSCASYGMQLIMLNKTEYAALSRQELSDRFPHAHIIPEGGANEAGIRGAAEIAALIPSDTTDVCVAIGTGTTLNGLYAALPSSLRLHGFYVARDFERTAGLLPQGINQQRPQVIYHTVADSRFGKWSAAAVDFIRLFERQTGIPLDVVYTSKMMMKVACLLEESYFNSESNIVCIHTGGLQGNPPDLFNQ